MSRDLCVALPSRCHGLSAVCDISWSYSPFFVKKYIQFFFYHSLFQSNSHLAFVKKLIFNSSSITFYFKFTEIWPLSRNMYLFSFYVWFNHPLFHIYSHLTFVKNLYLILLLSPFISKWQPFGLCQKHLFNSPSITLYYKCTASCHLSRIIYIVLNASITIYFKLTAIWALSRNNFKIYLLLLLSPFIKKGVEPFGFYHETYI